MNISAPSAWYLVAINAAVAGLEIAVCIAFTFIPPLLLKSGYSDTQMTIILGVAPFIAIFTAPVLGRWSDKCTSPYGRRRPFLVIMSVLVIFSLALLYFGQNFGVGLEKAVILAAGKLAFHHFCVILLDYSSQVAINPCEALVSDVISQDTEESSGCEFGFTVYSGMISLGACFGYLIIALDLEQWGIVLGNREQTAFALCIVLYAGCLSITLVTAKEKPLTIKASKSDSDLTCRQSLPFHHTPCCQQRIPFLSLPLHQPCTDPCVIDPGYVSDESDDVTLSPLHKRKHNGLGMLWRKLVLQGQILRYVSRISPAAITKCTFQQIKHIVTLPIDYYYTIKTAPVILRHLYYADLLSWISILAHAMFYTEFAAVVVYGGRPDAPTGSLSDSLFDEGVRMGSWGLLLHSITAGLYAVFVQEHVANYVGLKDAYRIGIFIHSFAMAATVLLSSNLWFVNLAAALSGVGYAVVTTIPNTLVTLYHEDVKLYYGPNSSDKGVGESIAILDSGYYLAQIILSLALGQIVEFTGMPHFYIIGSSVAGLVALYLCEKVVFQKSDLSNIINL